MPRRPKIPPIPDGPIPKSIDEAIEILLSVMGDASRNLLKSFASEKEMVDYGYQMREPMRIRLGLILNKSPELYEQIPKDRHKDPDRASDYINDVLRRRLRGED